MRQAHAGWLALSLLPLIVRFVVWSYRWQRILCRRHPVPYAVALRTIGAGAFVNLTTPTAKLGGGILRSVLVDRRYGWGLVASYGRVLTDQAANSLGSLVLFGTVALAAGLAFPQLAERQPLLIAGSLSLVLVALGLWARPHLWRRVRQPGFARFLARVVPERFRRKSGSDPDEPGQMRLLYPLLGEGSIWTSTVPDLLLGSVGFASIAVSNALVLRSLGVDADLRLVAVAVVVGYFGGSIVGAWGGIGITEVMLTGLYVRAGIPADAALAGALLHRAGFYLVVLTYGGACLLLEARLATRQRAQSEASTTPRT